MTKQSRRHHRHDDYGGGYEVAAALMDGPRTLEEIVDHFETFLRRVGFLANFSSDWRQGMGDLRENLAKTLENLVRQGWVMREGERYALTDEGRPHGQKVLAEIQRTGRWLTAVAHPEAVSVASLAVHLGLAAIKLPAGLLSGSVGLLNDALDTLLDGLSSLLVWAGFRFDRERQVNVVLVVLMLATGVLTFYHAVERFFVPFEPEVDAFTFVATLVSAALCGLLYLYQRFVGVNSGSLALITQSVDSRNHVIVAASVTAGLIAARVRFPLLDTLVGLAVAVLILKSAVELAVEVWRAMGEEEVDLAHYGVPLGERYDAFRDDQLRDWMLYAVREGQATTRAQLDARAQDALDFRDHPTLRALGLASDPGAADRITRCVDELIEKGLLVEGEGLSLSEAGKARLRKRLNPRRSRDGRSSRHGHRRDRAQRR